MGAGVEARYARWDGVGVPFAVVTAALPALLPPGGVLVEVDLATICGSDLHTVAGRRPAPAPSILGHEQIGRVGDVSETDPASYADGRRVAVGDRVVWSITVTCGQCVRCQRGMEPKCLRLRKYGHERLDEQWPLSGGFASHCLVLPGTALVRVPDAVPDVVAAPASCATATVAAVLDNAPDVAGRRVLVTGAGMLGLTAAAMTAAAGAAQVVVSDPDPQRRRLAERFGAQVTVAPNELPSDVDVVLELSGSADAVRAGLAALGVGGHLVLAGSVLPSGTVPVDPERIVRNLLTITGVHNYRPVHLATAVAFLAEHHERYPFAELVGGRFGLDELDAAVAAAPRSPAPRQAVVVRHAVVARPQS